MMLTTLLESIACFFVHSLPPCPEFGCSTDIGDSPVFIRAFIAFVDLVFGDCRRFAAVSIFFEKVELDVMLSEYGRNGGLRLAGSDRKE
jgi:hypothetical protein